MAMICRQKGTKFRGVPKFQGLSSFGFIRGANKMFFTQQIYNLGFYPPRLQTDRPVFITIINKIVKNSKKISKMFGKQTIKM